MVLADHMRASKRLRFDGSEDEYDMEDVLTTLKDTWSFDDICHDANFSQEQTVDSEVEKGSWVELEGQVLARVFHFLRADVKSFYNVGLTCKRWRSVLSSYKNVSRQVDFSSIAPICNDAVLWNIMVIYFRTCWSLFLYVLPSCYACFSCYTHFLCVRRWFYWWGCVMDFGYLSLRMWNRQTSYWIILCLCLQNGYNKEKISTLVLCACTNITSSMLEEVLRSFTSLSSVDIRGCSQLEDLASNFPNINWIRSRCLHSKTRSLKHITDKTSTASRAFSGIGSQTDDSSGLRDYLESSDRRDSANRLFRQSLYKRSKLFDARKSSSILSRDAHLRRLAMRKSGNGYKRVEQFLFISLKDIMKENTFEFLVPKVHVPCLFGWFIYTYSATCSFYYYFHLVDQVAEIEDRMRSGYYAARGLSSVKEDISRMCRDAIK